MISIALIWKSYKPITSDQLTVILALKVINIGCKV